MNIMATSRLAITAASLLMIPVSFAGQHISTDKLDASYSYTTKFVCGASSEDFQEGLVRGNYQTSIKVSNLTSDLVRFKKTISRAFPFSLPGATADFAIDEILPGRSLQIECDEIRHALDLPMTEQMREGFVQILSEGKLKVSAIYSARQKNGALAANDIERIVGKSLQCPVGYTGPRCAFQCVDGADCEIESYHDRQGNVISMLGRNTSLFPVSQADDGETTLDEFKAWIAEHSNGFGFLSSIVSKNLEIETIPSMDLVIAGGFNVHRYQQKYRGHPVIDSERIVTVSTTPGGALSFSGTLVNPAEEYDGLSGSMSLEQASSAMQGYAITLFGEGMSVGNVQLVAMPKDRMMGFQGAVHRNGIGIGTIIVSAVASLAGETTLISAHSQVLEDIDNQQPIAARVEDGSSNPLALPVESVIALQLLNGETLTAAEDSGNFDLSHPNVFLRDSRDPTPEITCEMSCSAEACDACDANVCGLLPPKCTYYDDLPGFPRISSDDNQFLQSPGSFEFTAQDVYYKTLNLLTTTGLGLNGQWDSLLRENSDFAPGTFSPRVLVTLGQKSDGECIAGAACATALTIVPPIPAGNEDFLQVPFAGAAPEKIGIFQLQPDIQTDHIVHEFGHIVDLFVSAGFMTQGVTCTGGDNCTAQCELGTSDEAPALAETIASMYGIWAYPSLFNNIDSTDCSVLPAMSLGGNTAPHNSICRPGGNLYATMSFSSFGPGLEDGEPTGACGTSPGYRTDAIFQAWWELLSGEVCSEQAPYECESFANSLPQTLEDNQTHGLGSRAPHAAKDAFLYALRVNSQSYEMFFDNMASYYACNYGESSAAYEGFCNTMEHHGIISCDAPPVCEICGNGELDPLEQCDDANGIETDGCLSTCEVASCGDGHVWSGIEACDDGNLDDSDACLSTCEIATCGDGIVQAGVEMCDDGNLNNDDGCSATCEIEEDEGGGEEEEECVPGELGCTCAVGPGLPGGGLLGNDMFCDDDVTDGGNNKCVQDGAEFICESCIFNQGWGCPCGVGEDSCLFSESDPGGLGPDLFCWGHTQAELDFTGNCWDAPPEWYCDAHCALEGLSCINPEQIVCGP